MRGVDQQQADMYGYISPESRVRADHPLRRIRTTVDEALNNMSAPFDSMYAKIGWPSIPPEKLLRAQLVQMLYSIRSERLLMEENRLQHAVPVVRGNEPGRARCGMRRYSPRTGTRCWKGTWRVSF